MNHLKTYLIVAFFIFAGYSADAQVTDWIKKQAKRVTKSDTYQRAKKSVSSVDPMQYFVDLLNENYDIDSYTNELYASFDQLNKAIHNNLNLYKEPIEGFSVSFANATAYSNKLALLQLEGGFKQYNATIVLNNQNYKLFSQGNSYFAVSDNGMPVNRDLLKIIKTAYWKDRSYYVNSEYFENIKIIASSIEMMNRYLIRFFDFSANSFNKILHFKYGKFSMELLLNEKLSSFGLDMNVDDVELNLNQINDSLKIMQKAALEIKNNCDKVVENIELLNQTDVVDYSQLDNQLKDMEKMVALFNTIAGLAREYSNMSKEYKDDFSHFVDFYGISFIEGFASLYDMAINQYAAIAAESEKRADAIKRFIEDINSHSSELYNESASMYKKINKGFIKKDIAEVNAFVGLYKQISKDKLLNQRKDPFIRYLTKINKQVNIMKKSSKTDFIKFLAAEEKLKDLYDRFPANKAENYYKGILSEIDAKQVIGGDYTDSYFNDYKRIISNIRHNKRAVYQLKTKTGELNKYYAQAGSSNTTFYIVLSLLLIGIIGGVVFKIFR